MVHNPGSFRVINLILKKEVQAVMSGLLDRGRPIRAEPFAARTNAFRLFRSKKRYVRANFPLSHKINDLVWWFAHMPSCLPEGRQ